MIEDIKIEKYPKFQLVKQKRWRRISIYFMETILRVDIFKKTKRYLLLYYLRYIIPIFIHIMRKRHGNIKPVVFAEFSHAFLKKNWDELKKDIFRSK